MQVRDVMTRGVEVVRPDATLQEAAAKMDELDVGPLPVCDGGRLVGFVTDRDITVRATAAGRDPRATRVREVMTTDLLYCFEDQDGAEAAALMAERQVRRLPVLDRDEHLVGIVSLGDLAVGADAARAAEALEQISEPARPDR